MRISNINPGVSFCAKKSSGKHNMNNKYMHDSLTTAGAWFGFGVGLDLVSRKCRFSKSPLKNSLALNGIIGAAAGIFVLFKGIHDKRICNR